MSSVWRRITDVVRDHPIAVPAIGAAVTLGAAHLLRPADCEPGTVGSLLGATGIGLAVFTGVRVGQALADANDNIGALITGKKPETFEAFVVQGGEHRDVGRFTSQKAASTHAETYARTHGATNAYVVSGSGHAVRVYVPEPSAKHPGSELHVFGPGGMKRLQDNPTGRHKDFAACVRSKARTPGIANAKNYCGAIEARQRGLRVNPIVSPKQVTKETAVAKATKALSKQHMATDLTPKAGFHWDRPTAYKLDMHVSKMDLNSRFDRTKVTRVPIDDLWATQGKLSLDNVKHFIRGGKVVPGTREPETPTLIRFDGRTYVWNGHHRIAAAQFQGQHTIDAKVIDV